ncbi:hypothetical protein niasHT_000274 [Heterodera trifolii]|uniref:Metalloendopeptidase n=2 Tax=Heterodera TaxID=34509 RepID=A0ABD2LW70_9BILA
MQLPLTNSAATMSTITRKNEQRANDKNAGKKLEYEASVFILSEVFGEIFDQQKGGHVFMNGVLSIVEKSTGVFIEWKPCGTTPLTALPDPDDTEWVIEGEEAGEEENGARGKQQKNAESNLRQSLSLDLNSIRSFIHGNLKKAPIWLRFICKDGTESDTYYFRGGGYESLVNCLQRYVFLTRSAKSDNLILISDSRTDALEKSVGMLNLDKKDIVSRFFSNPYATTMTLASKVTSSLAPLLDPEAVISENQLRVLSQQQPATDEDESSKLRQFCDSGFEHIFQLDLPHRPQILHRDPPVDKTIFDKFRSLSGNDGRILDSHGLKSLIFRGGISPEMRPILWKYMLGFFKWDRSDAENEHHRKTLEEDYYRMKLQWMSIGEDQESRFGAFRDRKALVEKDVARTDRSHPFFSRTNPENLHLLRDLLMTYCMYDFDLGYVQGMSDFLSVLCVVLEREVDIFWCFVGLMEFVHKNFELDQVHIKQQLSNLKSLVEIVNPRLANYLESHDSDHMYFCFRWILVAFKRELNYEDTQYLWEVLWTGIPCRSFLLLFCVAILDAQTDVIIENRFGLTEILKHVNNLSMRIDLSKMLCVSEAIYHQLAAVQDKLPRHVCEILSFNCDGNGTVADSAENGGNERRSFLVPLFAIDKALFDIFGGTSVEGEADKGGASNRHGAGGRSNRGLISGGEATEGGQGKRGNDDGLLEGLIGGGEATEGGQRQGGRDSGHGLLDGVLGDLGNTVQGLGKEVDEMINGVAGRFYAPDPNSDVPPHVLRRIMRFCSKHRQHEKCKGHSDWIVDKGILPELTGLTDELLEFPKIMKFAIPEARKLRLEYLLKGVPEEFVRTLPKGLATTLDAVTKQTLLSLCAGGSCKKQKAEYLNTRATLAELESVALRTTAPGKPIESIDFGIAVRQRRVYEVKKALIKYAGLEEQIEPANDGLFQQDILLTEQQSNAILTQIEHADENVMAISDRAPELIPSEGPGMDKAAEEQRTSGTGQTAAKRAKRAGNSLFMEVSPTEKWPTDQPIQFVVDKSLDASDKAAVRAAIREIQSKSCLRFVEAAASPASPHLKYIKFPNPAFCGTSYVGRVSPFNPIYLSFLCGNPMGVAVHETLHALGLQHEHVRPDRDNFITIFWNNMDPQRCKSADRFFI